MQNFWGGQTKSIMVFSRVVNKILLANYLGVINIWLIVLSKSCTLFNCMVESVSGQDETNPAF